MRKIRKFLRLKPGVRPLLLEAFFLLTVSRLALLTLKFKKIAPHLGTQTQAAPAEPDTVQLACAKDVGWSVRTASKHTLWESQCLVQAMAAKFMLNRRKIQNVLYLGVAKDEAGQMIAHAWVNCGGVTLTGAAGMEKFTVVSAFSS